MVFSWRHFFYIFFLLFILFFPTGIVGDFQSKITQTIFGDAVRYLYQIFSGTDVKWVDFSSDSVSMYILVALLLVLAFILNLFKTKWRPNDAVISIYLSIVLLKYGLDKLFKSQFYLPEPNILYSRFGDLDRDILFWSVMGTSYQISVVLGLIEIVIAVLLLIPKTSRIGAVLAFFTFLQIFLINLGFDISVKLYSFILLGMSFYLTFSVWKKIWNLLIKMPLKQAENLLYKRLFLAAKIFLVMWVLWLTIQPIFERKHWNDDLVERPPLHGVYRNLNKSDSIQYVFVHRDDYLIFINNKGDLNDFKFNLIGNNLITTGSSGDSKSWTYSYSKKDSILILKANDSFIKAKAENWRNMKALRPLFHVTVEQAD